MLKSPAKQTHPQRSVGRMTKVDWRQTQRLSFVKKYAQSTKNFAKPQRIVFDSPEKKEEVCQILAQSSALKQARRLHTRNMRSFRALQTATKVYGINNI